MPFYSIEIPTPNIPSTHLNALAQIRTPTEYIEVFWWPEKRLDIMEEHIMQLLEGEYVSNERNTIIDEKED